MWFFFCNRAFLCAKLWLLKSILNYSAQLKLETTMHSYICFSYKIPDVQIFIFEIRKMGLGFSSIKNGNLTFKNPTKEETVSLVYFLLAILTISHVPQYHVSNLPLIKTVTWWMSEMIWEIRGRHCLEISSWMKLVKNILRSRVWRTCKKLGFIFIGSRHLLVGLGVIETG